MRYLILLVTLQACAYEIPGETSAPEMYPEEIETAIAEWENTFGTSCSPQDLRVVVASGETLDALCSVTPSMRGCYSIVPRPERHVLVIAAEYENEDRNTVTHETMHWLGACTGSNDKMDHDNADVWGPGGILDRTNNALGLGHD